MTGPFLRLHSSKPSLAFADKAKGYNGRSMTTFSIRAYEPRDLAALYDICLKTGDAGEDASARYRDPELLGHVYAGPYAALEPELVFVLEDEAGVCGYVLGALDSARYYQNYAAHWLPPLQARYPDPAGDSAGWTADERICHMLHHPRLELAEAVRDYPSHLHIDLLPRAQGRGYGRRLMDRFVTALRERGSKGVHLGVATSNTRAQRFYRSYGFSELMRQEWGLTLVLSL